MEMMKRLKDDGCERFHVNMLHPLEGVTAAEAAKENARLRQPRVSDDELLILNTPQSSGQLSRWAPLAVPGSVPSGNNEGLLQGAVGRKKGRVSD